MAAVDIPLRLARHYSPVIYQHVDTDGADSLGGRSDLITNFNFDGKWSGDKKWENLVTRMGPATVYYDVVETTKHWFVTYAFYHARDWSQDRHENDMEAVVLMIRKGAGFPGNLVAALSRSNVKNFWIEYPLANGVVARNHDGTDDGVSFIANESVPEFVVNGHHPRAYIQAHGHDVILDNDQEGYSLASNAKTVTDWEVVGFPAALSHTGTGMVYYCSALDHADAIASIWDKLIDSGGAQSAGGADDHQDRWARYRLTPMSTLWAKRDWRVNNLIGKEWMFAIDARGFDALHSPSPAPPFYDATVHPPWAMLDYKQSSADLVPIETAPAGAVVTDPLLAFPRHFNGLGIAATEQYRVNPYLPPSSAVAYRSLKETSAYAASPDSLNSDNDWQQNLVENITRYPAKASLVTHALYPYPQYSINSNGTGMPALNPSLTAPAVDRVPLIIIHGWQGDHGRTDPSELVKFENSAEQYWQPFLNHYLQETKEDSKWFQVYLYKYPSYKHITYNARVLKELIASTLPNRKVVILAHSMGGLVARSLIEEHGFGDALGLITLATPYHGSPGAMKNWVDTAYIADWLKKDINTPGSNDLFWDNYDGVMEWARIDMASRGDGRLVALQSFDNHFRAELVGELGALSPYEMYDSIIHRFPNPWLTRLNEKIHWSGPSIPYYLYGGFNEGRDGSPNNKMTDDVLTDKTTGYIFGRGYANDMIVPVTSAFMDDSKHDGYSAQGERNPDLFPEAYPGLDKKSALYVDELITPKTKMIFNGDGLLYKTKIRFFKDFHHDRLRTSALAEEYRLTATQELYLRDCIFTETYGQGEDYRFGKADDPLFDSIRHDLIDILERMFPPPGAIAVPVRDADGTFALAWEEVSESGVTYVVEEATDSAFISPRTVYTGPGLTAPISAGQNATYYYRVKATKSGFRDSGWRIGSNGCAVPGTSAGATPATITVPGMDADGSYTVSWAASATSGVSYVVEEAPDCTFGSATHTVYSGPGTAVALDGRGMNTTNYYRVRAMKAGLMDSAWRVGNNGCAVPGASGVYIPASLVVPASDGDGTYDVSWAASTTSGVLYVLEEATNAAFTTGLRQAYFGTATSTRIRGRIMNTTYFYRVRAMKPGLKDSRWQPGPGGCAVPGTVTTASPGTLTIPATDPDGGYAVSWGASTTAGVSYLLEEATDQGFANARQAYFGPAKSKAITGRVQNTTYYFRVKAVRPGYNDSAWQVGANGCRIGAAPSAGVCPLNDTGIDWYGSADQNFLTSPPAGFEGQDADYGRDAYAADGALGKVGGGAAGFDFTKLDANGNDLGAAAASWSCVRDNHTGLIWEEKTNDGGLRDQDWGYAWYNSDHNTNGGAVGYLDPYWGGCGGSLAHCNTEAFVTAVNQAGLCGASDWRLPKRQSLQSIVHFGRVGPSIDTTYFPHTPSWSGFWSSSPYADSSGNAWVVYFGNGYVNGYYRGNDLSVRLVRGGQ